MKNTFFMAAAALVLSATTQAQSTVDSIEAKYTLLPMPGPLTIEQTFPAIGTYQLNNNNGTANTANVADNNSTNVNTTNTNNVGDLTITLDSVNKGIIWIEGLPEGRIKAYLKQSPATYRIVAQKSGSGEHVSEGTLVYDSSTHIINIALGAPYDEADPAGIFAQNPAANMATTDVNMQTDDAVTKEKTKVENNTVKHKAKTANGKSKSKVTYYTGTKVIMDNMNNDMNNNNMNNTGNMNSTDSTSQQQPVPATTDQQPQAPQAPQQPQTPQQPQSNPQ